MASADNAPAAHLEIVDTHCHLGHGDAPAQQVLERARAAGVTRVVDVGIDAATTASARERACTLDGVRFTAGLHPCDAGRLAEDWPAIVREAAHPLCVAIGETGFDFYWDRATRSDQRAAFDAHLELARRLDKPVVIHCRDAFDATFEALADQPGTRCVLHCFSGGIAEARRALDLGCALSFAGPLTYPRAAPLRDAAAFAPADRVLVETDAPFLPPQGRRGHANEPAFVTAILERLAAVRGTGLVAMAEQTTSNARTLFGWS